MQPQRKALEIETANQHQGTSPTSQQMIISTSQQMFISNGHFERSFHAAKTGQISHHFLRLIVDLSVLQLPLSSYFKSSDQGTAERSLMCLSKRGLRVESKASREGPQTVKKSYGSRRNCTLWIKMLGIKLKFHAMKFQGMLIWWKHEEFSSFQKGASVDTIFGFYSLRDSIL